MFFLRLFVCGERPSCSVQAQGAEGGKREHVGCRGLRDVMTRFFRSGRREDVDELLKEMKAKGCEVDTVFYNSMINGFCKNGEFDAAFTALDEMLSKKLKPDVFTFNTLIGSLCDAGRVRDAMDVFEDMPRWECLPDFVTYRMVFDGLRDAGSLRMLLFFWTRCCSKVLFLLV